MENEAEEKLTEEQFMIKVAGKNFRCDCGTNVFKKLVADPNVYVCNGCNKYYESY